MRLFSQVPERLPNEPALIREAADIYAIWTGRGWYGSIGKVRGSWYITTPASPVEVFNTFNEARAEAKHRALRADGRV